MIILYIYQKYKEMKIWLVNHSNNFISGAIMSIMAYYAPCKGMIIVAVSAILFDLLTGVMASLSEGKGIKSKRLWRTIYKLFFVTSLVVCYDSVQFPNDELHSGWSVGWLEGLGKKVWWSILENMARITDHPIFRILKRYMTDKIQDTTGVNLEENTIQNEKEDR